MYYNENDFTEVKGQFRKIVILVVMIALVFIITAIAFLLRQPQWIGATFLSVGVCLSIFVWGVYGTPIYSYYRYMKDIKEGRTQEIRGKVINVTDEPVYKDNRLLYYEITLEDEKDGVERLLLFDGNVGKPPYEVGSNYHFHTHQNYIIQLGDN
ncbi:MAG: hypothetical protein GX815_08765 [Clostridiales bacterium]|nr:hypothetical protein [Clostridiales bacterium]